MTDIPALDMSCQALSPLRRWVDGAKIGKRFEGKAKKMENIHTFAGRITDEAYGRASLNADENNRACGLWQPTGGARGRQDCMW